MSYVLLITNKDDITTDFVVKKLRANGVSFYRLNTEEITQSVEITLDLVVEDGYIYDKYLSKTYKISDFDAVYFRRPKIKEYEDQELCDGEKNFLRREMIFFLEGIYKMLQHANWLNTVDDIRIAENKIFQQLVAKKIGFDVADSIITTRYEDFTDFLEKQNCIIKPIKSGQIGDKIVFTNDIKTIPSREQIENYPNYLQKKIDKAFDVRVTVVGEKIFAVRIDSQLREETETDWRKGENILPHYKIQLPVDIEQRCIDLIKELHLGFGAIDLVEDRDGKYVFLEINPNGNWAWIEKQTGYDISGEIVKRLVNG